MSDIQQLFQMLLPKSKQAARPTRRASVERHKAAIRTRWDAAKKTKTIVVDAAEFKMIHDTYSADRIAEGKPIRKPFQWDGDLYCCVSGSLGLTMRSCDAYRLTPLSEFDGETTTYAEHARLDYEERIKRYGYSYHGMVVKQGRNEFVLTGPAVHFHNNGKEENG